MALRMSTRTCRDLLAADRRLQLALAGAFLGRLPLGLVTVLLLFAVGSTGRSLGLASVVSAAAVIGMAAGAPVQGRLLDRLGLIRVVSCYAALQAVTLFALAGALEAAPAWTVVALSFSQGATVPALSPCVRLVLRHRADRAGHGPAYTLDAVALEVIYLSGPALAAWGTVLVGPGPLLAGCAVLVVLGTAGFLCAARSSWLAPLTSEPTDRPMHGGGRPQPPDVRGSGPVVCFVLTMALLAAPFGLSEVALTGMAAEQGTGLAPVGSTLSLMGVGSVIGGLLYGAIRWRVTPARRFGLLALGLGTGTSAAALAPDFTTVHLLFALTGLCVAPLAGLSFEILDRLALPGAWMRTQSWGSVANTAGHAGGLTLGGALATTLGADGVLLLAGACVLAALFTAGPAFA
ncbi:hypothetical protein ACFC58_38160 [Kitasatospora purpeofusca]|uniref:hypothetical protein n=1 Tax=Kitasatospora purpeofusca TaxID=67352 RepID=UPI0035DF814D